MTIVIWQGIKSPRRWCRHSNNLTSRVAYPDVHKIRFYGQKQSGQIWKLYNWYSSCSSSLNKDSRRDTFNQIPNYIWWKLKNGALTLYHAHLEKIMSHFDEHKFTYLPIEEKEFAGMLAKLECMVACWIRNSKLLIDKIPLDNHGPILLSVSLKCEKCQKYAAVQHGLLLPYTHLPPLGHFQFKGSTSRGKSPYDQKPTTISIS